MATSTSLAAASKPSSLSSLFTRRPRWWHFILLVQPFLITFLCLHDRLLGPPSTSSPLFLLPKALPFLFAAYAPHSFVPLPSCPSSLQLSRFIANVTESDQRTLHVSATSRALSSPLTTPSLADGSLETPFPDVKSALDAVVELRRANLSTAITVALSPGLHYQPTSLLLTAAHSGTESAPLSITSADPSNPASLAGGFEIPHSCFQLLSSLPPAALSRIPTDSQPHLLAAHLPSCLSLDIADVVPRLLSYGFSQPVLPSHPQLYLDSAPLHLARWPNIGAAWQRVAAVVDKGSVIREGELDKRGFVFTAGGEAAARIKTWHGGDSISKQSNVWMMGYWVHDWAEQAVQVAAVVGDNLSSVHASHYGVKQNARYYFFNVLEELDSPGEYYVDDQGWLYLYPPHRYVTEEVREVGRREQSVLRLSSSASVASMPLSHLWISLSPHPIVTFASTHHIRLHHLTVELTRGSGIRILSSYDLMLDSLNIRRIGNVGIMCGHGAPINRRYTAGGDDEELPSAASEEWDGEVVVGDMGQAVYHKNFLDPLWDRHCGSCITITQSHLHTLGAGGVIMGGGDRLSLTAAHNAVTNNHIHTYSMLWHTYRPAVWLDGVGQLLAHNVISNGPHTAVLLNGNNHRVEYNDISAVCSETMDVGVIYTGRDLTQRGHRIAHNFIHHISALAPVLIASSDSTAAAANQSYVQVGTDASAIYFDDMSGGSTVTGNVFYRVHRAVLIGGGSGHTITHNLFLQCEVPVHIDARAITSHTKLILPGATLWQRLAATPVDSERWREEYGDELAALKVDGKRHERVGQPVNRVQHNVMVGCGPMHVKDAVTAMPVDNLQGGRQIHDGELAGETEIELVRVRVDNVNVSFVWNDTIESVRPLLYSRHSMTAGEGGEGGGHRHICYDVCVQYGWMVASEVWLWYARLASRAGWTLEDLDVKRMGACCMHSVDDGDGEIDTSDVTAALAIEAG